ncbi:hypothetical protein SEA_LIZZIANA_79 [Mycobacterium phage Lizziana]|uniref:Helix-turn-helix DNA binding domain protein n=8 Tax=Cheoctovirus TaxID=1623281 RepID=A0A3G2KHB7_9CAUD|nr:replication initiation protein [Mycobacterium phage Saal]YP_009018945.1 replication initiation protein [Mycobacterium phage GUmbie]YP_009956316.1 replication initiation protein [Mycobacterium phage DRBy19]YP_009957794.1 replication initiation protein [Mycobacterium phage Gorge]YP_009959239.1 replication initiation protein [Mycobacterium phage Lizziana]YP_009959542.1 replication initiation protein [Mycobacterium phage Mattes]YP_009960861.1 replication initiation protein [Mycobacterium phage
MGRKATGKDHSEINLAIWGDDDWLDLTPPAQHLYFVLWTSPQLSYCGSGEWHAGRIAAMAKGWTVQAVEAAAAELSRDLFLIIDTNTDEFLLRSWIKHDGLWRKPNMAVSMANARAALASRTLRGVVVHEVKKIKARNEADAKANSDVIVSAGWQRDAVKELLDQKAIDPATLEPFTPGSTPSPTPPLTPGPTPGPMVKQGDGVNPPPNPGATPTPAPFSFSNSLGGYVSTEGHLDADGLPTPYCSNHPKGTNRPCAPCAHAREARDAVVAERKAAEKARRSEIFETVRNCPLCDDHGRIETEDGLTYCDAHLRLKDAG